MILDFFYILIVIKHDLKINNFPFIKYNLQKPSIMTSSFGKAFNASKRKGIHRMLQKGRAYTGEGSRVRVLIKTICYIVTKMFSFQKK